eukprot:405625-Prymnesium_polylepis.3
MPDFWQGAEAPLGIIKWNSPAVTCTPSAALQPGGSLISVKASRWTVVPVGNLPRERGGASEGACARTLGSKGGHVHTRVRARRARGRGVGGKGGHAYALCAHARGVREVRGAPAIGPQLKRRDRPDRAVVLLHWPRQVCAPHRRQGWA